MLEESEVIARGTAIILWEVLKSLYGSNPSQFGGRAVALVPHTSPPRHTRKYSMKYQDDPPIFSFVHIRNMSGLAAWI